MSFLTIPSRHLDEAIETAVADIGSNPLTLSAISADLRYHTKAIQLIHNDLKDLARNFQRACVNSSPFEAETVANDYESARLVLLQRQGEHKAAVTRLERAKNKFLWCLKEMEQ